jgi:integrase
VQFNRKGGGYYFKALKTQRSRRRIDVSESLRQLLQAHKIEQNMHRLAMRGTWFDHGLVFPNEIGRPFAINNLTRRHLKPILDKCDFPKHVTLYSLRHTCATMLLLAGVNPKVVADRLGHSSVVITLDTYSHVLPSLQADATELINQAMRMKAV